MVTLFNGDKSPLLGAFCINSVGVIVTLILCISHIAFKCCIKHQVNDIQGVPEKKEHLSQILGSPVYVTITGLGHPVDFVILTFVPI